MRDLGWKPTPCLSGSNCCMSNPTLHIMWNGTLTFIERTILSPPYPPHEPIPIQIWICSIYYCFLILLLLLLFFFLRICLYLHGPYFIRASCNQHHSTDAKPPTPDDQQENIFALDIYLFTNIYLHKMRTWIGISILIDVRLTLIEYFLAFL